MSFFCLTNPPHLNVRAHPEHLLTPPTVPGFMSAATARIICSFVPAVSGLMLLASLVTGLTASHVELQHQLQRHLRQQQQPHLKQQHRPLSTQLRQEQSTFQQRQQVNLLYQQPLRKKQIIQHLWILVLKHHQFSQILQQLL